MSNTMIAIICEGAAEQKIIEILLDNHCLIFSRNELLEEEVLRCRSASNFQKQYLSKFMDSKITLYRILDSKQERFTLSGPFKKRVEVINIITSPEIEMLIIHAENKYDDYKNKHSHLKPSKYVKTKLKLKNVKSSSFIEQYFSDYTKLIHSIHAYRSKASNKENTLYDLLEHSHIEAVKK